MKLALGTAQLGFKYGIANQNGQVNKNEVKKILNYAQKIGVDTLDTAILYGESEKCLGEFDVREWKIISKLPGVPLNEFDLSAWIFKSFADSLKRLKVEKLYGFLLHRPQDLLGEYGQQIYNELLSLKQNGQIQKIGISIYDPSQLDELFSRYQFDIVQAPFNLLDQRLYDSGWLSRLKEQNIEVHVRSIFLQGLLLMSKEKQIHHFGHWSFLWSQLENWLNSNKLTPLQACLRYVLSFSQIDKLIIGVDNLKQLEEIYDAVDGDMSEFPNQFKMNDVDLINPSRWSMQ